MASPKTPQEAIIEMLHERTRESARIRQGARRVGYTDPIDAFYLHWFGYLGDAHAPARGDVEDLVTMYDNLYLTATIYKRVEWAVEQYNKYVEDLQAELTDEEEKAAKKPKLQVPMFEDWFINMYLMPMVYLCRGKLTNLMIRSPTAFEREQQVEETRAVLQTLQLPPYGKKGPPASIQSSIPIEDVMKREQKRGGPEE